MKFMKDPVVSKMLAKEYMLILEKQFVRLKVEVTPAKLYMAWNMGFSGAKEYNFNVHSIALDSKRASILKRANQILSR
jgi:DNA polymerase/3'-5' exonuclease PolX